MTNKHPKNVKHIAAWRLCTGCGACVAVCPEHNIRLVNVIDQGLRPILNSSRCQNCGECVKVCPGAEISHQPFNSETIPQLRRGWGPVLEVWQGYATDPEIRYKSSSGGVVTALALYCIEKKQACGVLHIAAKRDAPLQNTPVFSTSRQELLAAIGSRYCPAAPCEKFDWLEQAARSVFIGKPCDVLALRKAQAIKATLDSKVGLAISIFCAGTPATEGTFNLLNTIGVKPEQVEELRYRGFGWPGATTVKLLGNNNEPYQLSYEKSWGDILSKYVPLRCRLCPDGTGEFADISCGDAWHREIKDNEPGWSLVLARTEPGRNILQKAQTASYIHLIKAQPDSLPQSQKFLLKKRCNLWGRLLAMQIMGIPVPHFDGFSLLANWRRLHTPDKIRSVFGTIKRSFSRKLYRPVTHFTPNR